MQVGKEELLQGAVRKVLVEGGPAGGSVSKQEFLPKCFFSSSCTPPFWQFHLDYYFQTAMRFSTKQGHLFRPLET